MLRPLCVCWAYASGTYAYAERARQELMRALSIRVRNWCVHWAYASVTNTCTECSPFKTCWAYASGTDAYPEHTHEELMRMLSIRISSLRVCSAWFVGTSITYGRYKNGKLMRMLSIRISSWRVCSACAPVPCAYAQLAHQFLMRMLSIRIKAGAYA